MTGLVKRKRKEWDVLPDRDRLDMRIADVGGRGLRRTNRQRKTCGKVPSALPE